MRMKGLIVLTAVSLASGVWGREGIEVLKEGFASVTVTPTNITLSSAYAPVWIRQKDIDRWLGDDEDVILTPDCETTLTDMRHVALIFKPASFKNKKKGFWLVAEVRSLGKGLTTINMHLVLSDTPMKVGEDDVEMIMENGEWKTVKEYHAIVEREKRLYELWSEHIHKRREAEALFQGEELINKLAAIEHEIKLKREQIEAGEQAEVCPPSRCLWLYALIPPCLLAILWLVKRKRKRETKKT